jgi:small GTP-binding protein
MEKPLINKFLKHFIADNQEILSIFVYEREDYSLINYYDSPDLNESQSKNNFSLIHQFIDEIDGEYGKLHDFLLVREKQEIKLAFCSTDSYSMILLITEKSTNELDLKIYSVHLAGEITRILTDNVEIPEDIIVEIPSTIKLYSKVKKIEQTIEKLLIKIVVIGDYKVGKTSLINQFTEKSYDSEMKSTNGFNVLRKVLNIDDTVVMNLAIWDTGGLSSQISPQKEKIYKFSDVVLIVLDINNHNYRKNIEKWYAHVIESVSYKIPIFIALTKDDLKNEEVNLSQNGFEEIIEKYNIEYFLVSAKTGKNVDNLFYEIIYAVINSRIQNENYELIEDTQKYKGYYLEKQEIEAIHELEQMIIERLTLQSNYSNTLKKNIEEDGIPIVFEIEETTFGIKIEDGCVVGLGLFNCNLSTLPESIDSFKSLKKLCLRSNELIKLPIQVTEFESLEKLDVAITNLAVIPEALVNMRKLKTLHLENNAIVSLPKSIGNLKSLEKLYLENNPIKFLPESFCNLSNLRKLYLEAPSYFFLGDLKELPYNFGNLTSLQELDLSSCELNLLPETFGNLKSLKYLDLYNNKLSTLPNTFGNLKLLEILNLEGNNLKYIPNSVAELSNLKSIRISNNPLQRKASEKFKALALKSKGIKYERLMKLSEVTKQEETTEKDQHIGTKKQKLKNVIKPLTYASIVAFLGIITFLSFRISIQTFDITIWTLFSLAIFINLIIGACIIATISSYFKVSTILLSQKLIKIFDIFVIFYFVWALRALLKRLTSIEFIPSINFLFEFSAPEWMLNFFIEIGYNINLTFLDNVDLFFGHFYLKIFSIALVFWALYRNGFTHVRKTIFDEKTNKKLWYFLILGLFGALSLAIMKYSNLEPYLDIGYSIGVIIGSCIFIWEINRIERAFFYYYLSFITGSILLIWYISLFNLFYSFIISILLIGLFFLVRLWHNRKIKYYHY